MPPQQQPPDNSSPRYLPHMQNPEALHMGLSPLGNGAWIETDHDLPRYHCHKLRQRRLRCDGVYRALPSSQAAQEELAQLLLQQLDSAQQAFYNVRDGFLEYSPTGLRLPLRDRETLWNCSLWVADDLLIMEQCGGEYCLTAASLCSPSDWLLQEKFGQPLRAIHDPVPGFHQALTPRIDRFFAHLRPDHPVVRFNWSIQAGDELSQLPRTRQSIRPDTALFYRTERQSLLRLPQTGAVAFTIRVYLHPLELLQQVDGAMDCLWRAIEATPEPLARYKGFHRIAPALHKYTRQY